MALVITAAVFVLLYLRIRNKTSSTVTVMPFMADAGGFWMYFLSQAFGWSALLWAWGTVYPRASCCPGRAPPACRCRDPGWNACTAPRASTPSP
ncbi:membrane protein [Streptomyces badius]